MRIGRYRLLASIVAVTCAIGIALAEPVSASQGLPRGSEPVDLDPAQFTTAIDNPYWPMRPGTRWTYHESDGADVLEVVVVVTRATKRVANGIRARSVRDTVRRNGEIVEDTVDWYAQDRAGNVWYLGEDTAEFEHGEVTSRAGSWEAGVDGALPGVALPAHPRAGMRYRQEYAADRAEDNGAVLSTDEMADVPLGHFADVLLTKDTNALEPKVLEYKFYAKGVGPILTLDVSGGSGREELVRRDRAPRGAGLGPLGSPAG
jgi:hypothetical protein